jgi:hypothetical protein
MLYISSCERGHYWEVNSLAAGQEFSHILQKPKFHQQHSQQLESLSPILSQIDLVSEKSF